MFKKLVGLLTVAVTGLFLSGVASAQILGSVHDFQTELGTGDLCAVCHTPHNDTSGISEAPLWDHALTVQAYTPYSTSTLDADDVASTPTGISALCLSCHDGTVAVDAYGGSAGLPANQIDQLAAWSGIGTGMLDANMNSEHPVSFTYATSAAADTGIKAAPTGNSVLFAGKVECASCHDVHDQATATALLLDSNAGSALCLNCHIK